MIHFGDICKMDGAKIPVVDIITFGAPCQDLSVAGNRKGMLSESRGDAETTRSGLFFEAIRIIKEMRENDRRAGRTGFMVRPRFAVYENVPGAFSSNKGKDFQAVLTEIVKIAEPDAPDVPMPEGGRWSKSGCLYSDVGAWSIAWRVHDAQFWGVPQRRKRIALVADFGGLAAPEILFEREGLSGYSEPGRTARKETAGAVGGGVANTGGAMNPWDSQSARVYPDNGVWHSLNANENGGQSRDSVFCLQGNGIDRDDTAGCDGRGWCEDVSYTLNTIDRPAVAFAQNQRNEVRDLHDVAGALAAEPGVHQQTYVFENHSQDSRYKPFGDVCETVNAKYGTGGNNQPLVVSDVLPFDTTQVTSDKNWSNPHYGDPCHPLAAQAHVPSIASPSVVRRLTPLECERLQGYPDGWTDIGEWVGSKGKKHKEADSPRYKALGNSIALPFWAWMARRICAQYERPMTMGSLFDGIGGFPLVFERAGAKAVWASEIEEFCVAVTKKHFPEEVTNE